MGCETMIVLIMAILVTFLLRRICLFAKMNKYSSNIASELMSVVSGDGGGALDFMQRDAGLAHYRVVMAGVRRTIPY